MEAAAKKRVAWMVQQSGIWGLDLVSLFESERAALAEALALVVYWEEKAGHPVETKATGLHMWRWPSEGSGPGFTVLMTQTPIKG